MWEASCPSPGHWRVARDGVAAGGLRGRGRRESVHLGGQRFQRRTEGWFSPVHLLDDEQGRTLARTEYYGRRLWVLHADDRPHTLLHTAGREPGHALYEGPWWYGTAGARPAPSRRWWQSAWEVRVDMPPLSPAAELFVLLLLVHDVEVRASSGAGDGGSGG